MPVDCIICDKKMNGGLYAITLYSIKMVSLFFHAKKVRAGMFVVFEVVWW